MDDHAAIFQPVTVKVEVTEEDLEEAYSKFNQNISKERHFDQSDDIEQPWSTELPRNRNIDENILKKLKKKCQQKSEVKIVKTDTRQSGRPRTTREEKRQKSRERSRRYKAKHVNLGDQKERWAVIKRLTELDNDSLVAKMLLDFYLDNHPGLNYKWPRTDIVSGESDSQSFPSEETDSLNDNRTKANNDETKDEVSVGDSYTDAAIEKPEMKVKDEINTDVNDDYSTDDSMSVDAKVAECDDINDYPSIKSESLTLTNSDTDTLLENNRGRSLKRKRLSDCESNVEGIS